MLFHTLYLEDVTMFIVTTHLANTVVPQYSSLTRSGICDEFPKPMSTKRWSVFSCGTASWLIKVLANARSSEQAPNTATFFSCQNVVSAGFDEFWSQRVPRCDCQLKLGKPQCNWVTLMPPVDGGKRWCVLLWTKASHAYVEIISWQIEEIPVSLS